MLHKYKYKYSYAASSPWTQSNWAGGSGQTSWSDITKFSTSTNVTTSTPNQITLASAEKFSNTTFDTDLTSWTGTQSYTLDDEFTTNRSAGAVNGTSAEPTGGTRTVTDTGSKISIASSALTFATGETTNDGLWYTSLARGAGKTLFQKIVPSDTNGIINIGWDTNTSGAINDRLVFAAAGVLQIVPNGGSAIAVGTYTATTYYIAGVMRSTGFYWYIKGGAFTNWSLLWQSASGTAAGIPSLNVGSTTSVFTADDIRVPTTTWMPTPLAYDSFTRADGAIGSTETTGPDSQTTSSLAWTGGAISSNTNVITPTLGSELLTDGGLENWTSATNLTSWTEQIAGTSTVNQESSTIHGGTYSVREDIDASNNFGQIFQALTNFGIGNYGSVTYWARSSATGKTLSFAQNSNSGPARNPGTTWTQYTDTFRSPVLSPNMVFSRFSAASASLYFDDISVKALTLSSLFSTVSTSTSDVLEDVNVTLTSGTQAGLVLNLDSTSSPANFVIAYHDGTNVHLDKAVAGTYTSLINTAATYSAGATLRVVKDGTSYSVFYNNAKVGSTQTISDAGIISNTKHGLFSTYSSNSFDNFTLWPRGTGGEYNTAIPADDLTATEDATHTRGSSTGAAKLIAGTNANSFYQNVNVGDTGTYNMVAYVYTDGSAVSSSDAQLVANRTLVSTTYTADSGGWYKLTGTATGVASSVGYGVQVKAGKTVWVDDMSLQPQSLTGTLTSSVFDTGQRSSWGNLTYTVTTPTGTSASVKVITSDSSTISTAFSSCSAITSGQNISTGGCSSGGRYIQYQITLSTTDLTQTPTFSTLSINFTAQGNTYYVSQSGGSDSNDGLTSSTPWQTIAKVNASTFLPGDTILFKKGDTWRELLDVTWSGTSGNPITFSAYGTGDLPKFETSAAFNNTSDWTNIGTNIWQTAADSGTTGSELLNNTSFDTNTNGWAFSAQNTAVATMSQTITSGEYNSSPGGAKIVVTSNGTASSDIQLYNSTSFTIQNDKYYQLSFWAKASTAFSIQSTSLLQNGSPFTGYSNDHPAPNITTSWAHYTVFFKATSDASDARINFYLGNAIPDGATFYIDDISFKQYTPSTTLFLSADVGNISFNNDASFGHKKLTSTADLTTQGDFYFDPNIFVVDLYSTSNPANLYSSIELGLNYSTINLNANSYITIKNLHILNTARHGISGDSGTNNIEISDNELSNIGGAIQSGTTRYGNAIQFFDSTHDITVERNKIWEVYDAALTTQGTAGTQYNIYFRNNIIWNAELGVEEFLRGSGAMYNVYVDNNTISNLGSQSSHVDRPDPRARGIIFYASNVPTIHDIYVHNNIISETTEELMQFDSIFTSISNLVVKNNLLFASNASNNALQWNNSSTQYDLNHISCGSSGCWQYDYSSIAQNNLATDPQFVDSIGHNYLLQSTSPAINAGADLSSLFTGDYSGTFRPQGSAFDIGAYEMYISQTSDSGSGSGSSGSGCSDLASSGVPDLFQINTNNTTATLYFAPPVKPYSNFYIAYSTKPGIWQYGVQFDQKSSGGVLKYTINALKPNTKYYFRIRSGNGCATGNWGNTMTAITTNSKTKRRVFYKNIITKVVQKTKDIFNNFVIHYPGK